MRTKRVSLNKRWLAITCLWIIVIFFFTQLQMFTGRNTGAVLNEIIKSTHLNPYNTASEMSNQSAPINSLNLSLRKMAHMLVFGILAALFFQSVKQWRRPYVFAWVFTVVYASLDEYHQSFVSGRVATIRDVAFDALGAGLALMIIYYQRRRHQQF